MRMLGSASAIRPRLKSLHAAHGPYVASLRPEAVKQDPLSIRGPDGVVDSHIRVGKFVDYFMSAKGWGSPPPTDAFIVAGLPLPGQTQKTPRPSPAPGI